MGERPQPGRPCRNSTKQIEDAVGWGHEIDPATLVATVESGRFTTDRSDEIDALCARVECPVLVVHGTEDRIRPFAVGERLAELTGGTLVAVDGGGHGPHARHPVLINRLVKDFVDRTTARTPAAANTPTPATSCDLAIVQGGLTTCMELTANRRPFIFVPLRNHFEQLFHVRHRLARYGAGRCMPYDELDPDTLATAVSQELDRTIDYRPVATDGAARAAGMLAELL